VVIRSLKVSDFDLNAGTVTVSDAYSKNRKASTLPLRPEMVTLLSSCLAGKFPGLAAFKMPDRNRVVDMFRADIAHAREQWLAEQRPEGRESVHILKLETEEGRIDFHALRHSCASFLVHAGVDPKTCQELMRHSTVELTPGKYSHVYRGKTSEAVAMLPDFTRPKETEQLKTGTDDSPVDGQLRSAFCSDEKCGENEKQPESPGEKLSTQDGSKAPFRGEKPHFEATGPGWIRTNVGVSRRIYSPSPLATRAPTLERGIIHAIAQNARGWPENFGNR
jgi:hypothetical protein